MEKNIIFKKHSIFYLIITLVGEVLLIDLEAVH